MTDKGKRIHDELARETNMTPAELRRWRESENFDVYKRRKSGGEDIDKPLDDMITLLETPADEYDREGFNEIEEGKQAINFLSRMKGVEQGDPMPGSDPPLSKRDASLINWGFDPEPNDNFP